MRNPAKAVAGHLAAQAAHQRHARSAPSRLLLALVQRSSFLLWRWLGQRWAALQRWRIGRRHESATHMQFEALEPRLLLSGDLVPAASEQAAAAAAALVQVRPVPIAINLAPIIAAAAPVTVQVAGAGSAQLVADGANFRLALTGTDGNTAVALLPATPGARVQLTGITSNSAVGDLFLGIADLQGTAAFAQGLRTLQVGALQGASVQVGGSGNLALDAGAITNSSIDAPGAVLSLSADSFTSDAASAGHLRAAAITSMTVRGDIGIDLQLLGASGLRDTFGDIQADGSLTRGVWDIEGRGRTLAVQGSLPGWRMNASGTMLAFSTRGDASGSLAAASLQQLSVGGSMRGMTVYVGADLGSDAAVGGAGADADRFDAGRLARLNVAGQMVDSRIYVSIDPVDGIYGNGNDIDLGTVVQRVQQVTVTGPVDPQVRLVAPGFPTSVIFGGQAIPPDQAPGLSNTHNDRTAPVLSAALRNDTGASAQDGLTSDASIGLSVSDAGPVTIEARSGTQAFQAIAPVLQADGTYLVTPQILATLAGGHLGDGPYSFEFRARDAANNSSPAVAVPLTLDTTPPVLTRIALDPAGHPVSDLATTADVVKLVGVTEAGMAVTLRRTLNGPALGSTTAGNDGSFSFDGIALPQMGANGLVLVLTDAAGNRLDREFSITRQPADAVPPTLAASLQNDTGASASDHLTKDPTVAGHASDDVGVTRLEAVLDPGATPSFADITSNLQGDGSFSLTSAQLATLAGGTLSDGAHTLRLRASDAAGNAATQDLVFTLDRAAPATATLDLGAAFDTGAAGDQLTSAGSVTLQGSSEAAAQVSLLQGATVLATTTAAGDGSFSFAGVPLAAGANAFSLAATDAAGNTLTRSFTFTRDITAPTVSAALQNDTGASASDGITSDPAIVGNASDNLAVTRLEAVLDPGASPVFSELTLAADGSFSLTGAQLATLGGGTLTDGSHTLRLRATDAAGNSSTRDLLFLLDRLPPPAVDLFLAPASDTGTAGDGLTQLGPVTLMGGTEPAAQVTLMQGSTVIGTATAANDFIFSFVVALAPGANTFDVRASDAAGNTLTRSFTFTRDSTAPTVSAALQNDTGASASDGISSDPAIIGSVSDNVAVARLQAALDPGAAPSFSDVALPAGGNFALSAAQLATLAGGSLADGAHTLRLRVTDTAGNASSSDFSITLDRAAPSVASFDLAPGSDSAPAGDHATTAAVVTLAGSTEAGTQLTLTSGATVLGTTTAAADGSFSFAGVPLALGANDFTLGATDAAGNTAAQGYTFTRLAGDLGAPVVSLALQNDTGRSASDRITTDAAVAGRATDDVAVTSLEAVLDPGAAPTFTDILARRQPDGSFVLGAADLATLAGGPLADGTHTLRIRAGDGSNSTTQDLVFTLDTQAPVLPTLAIATVDALPGTDNETAASIVQLRGSAEAGADLALAAQGLSAGVSGTGVVVLPGVSLALGDNALTFSVTDAAGNTSSTTRTFTRVAQASNDGVLAWNDIALRAVQLDVTDVPVATRLLAMESLAVYDTLAAIEGTPAYMVQRSVAGPVSADAAVAVAAHRILSLHYPAQRAVFDAALAGTLAGVADGAAKDAGIALGLSVADAVWQLRQGDGYDAFITYSGGTGVGQWRPVGPMFGLAQDPQWQHVTPFALSASDALRRPPPPAVDSAAYAAAVEEIKHLGSATGSDRTADQTQQAQFWADGSGSYTPPGHWNQIAEEVARSRGNSLSANARLFAQLNVALADSAIACWDTKYAYGLWRPETAIQNADVDGNAGTTVDASWRPLLLTPPHPEYVSGHSTFSAAAASILANTFGDATSFSTTSATLPGVTRSFTSFTQAAEEAGRSRIYGGIHFEFSNQAGQQLGHEVAAAVLARFALTQDTQAPSVVLQSSAAAVASNITIQGQVLDNLSGVAAAQYRVDSGPLADVTLDANARFSITTALAVDGSADGSHTITLIARDVAGNISGGFTRSFVLDTRSPVVTLTSIADDATLTGGIRLTGAADAGISGLALLQYSIDGAPARSMSFDRATGAYDEALNFGNVDVGSHQLVVTARDGAGNTSQLARTVHVDALAPFTVTSLTPLDGSIDVGVTVRPQVRFSRAVNVATLTSNSFYATAADGSRLDASVVPGVDGSYAWLFFANPMPGGTQITLHVEGSMIRAAADGAFLDGDGNGTAGGAATVTFTTVSTTSVAGTRLVGRVVDPGPDLLPMTFDDIRRGPDGIIHTADDVFLLPIAHAKVYILGQEGRFVFTDAQGNFSLDDVPAGTVKVAVDGRTASNAPAGVFFPEMVMDVQLRAGVTNTVMAAWARRRSAWPTATG